MLEAMAEFPAHHVAAQEHLVTAHLGPGVFIVRGIAGEYVDQLDDPVAVAAGGGNEKLDFHRPGDGDIVVEHRAFIHQHIRAARRKALVFHHEGAGHAGGDLRGEGHRQGGIADIFITAEDVAGIRRVVCQLPFLPEVERRLMDILRRPDLKAMPAVSAGLENIRFRQIMRPLLLQVMIEERQFDILDVKLAGRAAELNIAQRAAVGAHPAAVVPWAHHQKIVGLRIALFDCLVRVQGAIAIFGIKPASHHQHRRLDIVEILGGAAAFPEFIIGTVVHHLVPEGDLALQILLVGIGQRPHLQEKIVSVRGAVIEARRPFGGQLRTRHPEGGEKSEGQGKVKGAVMVKIVTDEPFADRGLGRYCLQGRMGLDRSHRGIKAGIGDAPHPHPSVVIG